jgi:hypothetical protein
MSFVVVNLHARLNPSILQQVLQNWPAATLRVAEERQDAEYKDKSGAYRGTERCSFGEAAPWLNSSRSPQVTQHCWKS